MTHHHHHPYYPLDLELPGYVPMTLNFEYILGVFFAAVAAVFILTWLVAGTRRHLSPGDKVVASWFMVTGLIHFVIEGKEYAKADSRYATRDSFIISMEAVTAFVWGPACLAVTYGILGRKPWRLPLMIVVSLGQIYGDVLYYATCWLEGFAHSRPEVLYFWIYFVIINSFWIIIPSSVILYAAGKITTHAVEVEGDLLTSSTRNGKSKSL
ncbi:hypothetical protein N2152v2_002635 [Parachlorella kessleri]